MKISRFICWKIVDVLSICEIVYKKIVGKNIKDKACEDWTNKYVKQGE
jgi:hypothetical protein